MGYKLAGCDYLGGVEIDPKVAEIYKKNLKPKHLFCADIRDFNSMELPEELYSLDILDGSPPCTSFSMNGVREKHWGKKKKFDEGQVEQTLDDLVFVYCDTIARLMPKVCVLENVEGLIKGNAKVYAKAIMRRIEAAGYDVQLFLLNSKHMGVPQERMRVFFIGRRKDMNFPPLALAFNEPPILFREVADFQGRPIKPGSQTEKLWKARRHGNMDLSDSYQRLFGKRARYSNKFLHLDRVHPTVTTTENVHYTRPVHESVTETKRCATFPEDYDAPDGMIPHLAGMCVPPVMTAQIATKIHEQWFSDIQ